MNISFEPIGETFAARVHGADLKTGIGPQEAEQIEDALARFGVLVFHNQDIGDDEQQAFIQQFGPPVVTRLKEIATSHPHFYDISTVDDEGNPIPADSARGMYLQANLLWHTDGSQNQPPIRLTALHGRVLPPVPPDTQYADMRAAWNALPASRRAELDGLTVEHNILWSREQIGMKAEDFSEETRRERVPVHHPLVRTNARTGAKSLYLASHASHIVGRPLEEGRALIKELMEFATQPQFVYSHAWSQNDLVMWDDSWTMHRATPYKDKYPRQMRWCGVRELHPV